MTAGDRQPIVLRGIARPEPGHVVRATADGKAVAIFNRDGKLYAIGAVCTHAGGPLDEGAVSGFSVTCPWHGSVFDLQTGAVTTGPARRGVPSYHVKLEAGDLVLDPVGP